MIAWLLDTIPAWVWVTLGAIACIAAYRLLGLKGMLAALAALITLGAYRSGRRSGAADATAKQKETDRKAVQDYEDIKTETDRMSDEQLDAANAPWVRRGKQR